MAIFVYMAMQQYVTIASGHPRQNDVDLVFPFDQNEYEFVFRLMPCHSEMFVCKIVHHTASKFLMK